MPTRSSSSIARSRARSFGMSSCARICSAIWSPIRSTGFSDAIGSWKIIAISAPRTRCSCASEAPSSSVPLYVAVPPKRAFGERVSPSSVIAVTDLPQPDSPTTARISPGAQVERDAVDGLHDALVGRERHREVAHAEDGLRAS